MGVDLETYRVRVGMFKPRCTRAKQLETSLIIVHEPCGAPEFIKEQLVRQGIHPNPGPDIGIASVAAVIVGWKIAAVCSVAVIAVAVVGGRIFLLLRHSKKKKENTTQGGHTKQAEVRKIHYEMIHKLSAHLDPSYPDYWQQFCNLMCKHLSFPEIHANNVVHVKDIFEKLRAKRIIAYGNYENILDDLGNIHVDIAEIVKNATNEISSINNEKATYAELEQQRNDIHRIHQGCEQKLAETRNRELERQEEIKKQHAKEIIQIKKQHAKEIEEKNHELDELRQTNRSEVGTSSAVLGQGYSNIRHRNIIFQAPLAN